MVSQRLISIPKNQLLHTGKKSQPTKEFQLGNWQKLSWSPITKIIFRLSYKTLFIRLLLCTLEFSATHARGLRDILTLSLNGLQNSIKSSENKA